MRPTQCVGGLYLTVADSLAPLPNNNNNNVRDNEMYGNTVLLGMAY